MNMLSIKTHKSIDISSYCGYSNDDYYVMLSYIETVPFSPNHNKSNTLA